MPVSTTLIGDKAADKWDRMTGGRVRVMAIRRARVSMSLAPYLAAKRRTWRTSPRLGSGETREDLYGLQRLNEHNLQSAGERVLRTSSWPTTTPQTHRWNRQALWPPREYLYLVEAKQSGSQIRRHDRPERHSGSVRVDEAGIIT